MPQLYWIAFHVFFYSVSAPDDYTEVMMTLTFSQSNIREQFAVRIQPDVLDEEDETFRAVLSIDPGEDSVQLIPAEATVTITDDDGKLKQKYWGSMVGNFSEYGATTTITYIFN